MDSSPPAPPGTRITGRAGVSRGRALVATRTFQPGELIAAFDAPILALPDGERMRLMCNYCLRRPRIALSSLADLGTAPSSLGGSSTGLRACTGCRAAVYCDAECQRLHWREVHKHECKVFKRVRERAGKDWLPTPVRAVLQVVAKMQTDSRVAEAFRPGGWLEGNVEGFKSDKAVWEDIELQTMAAAVYGDLRMDTIEVVKEIFCKIQTNAFDRSDADTGMAGIYLEPSLAMANHSCIPNAYVSFDKRAAFLHAEREIKAGEDIEISYTDYNMPRETRQQALRAYHFECVCPRCWEDLNVYEVCRASPLLPLNSFSLAPDIGKLRAPQVDKTLYLQITSEQVQDIHTAWHRLTIHQAGGVMERSKMRWELCKPLIEAKMWAVEPVPSSLLEMAVMFQTASSNFVSALSLACFVATECTPFKLVAPFNAFRIKGVLLISKLLSQTAEFLSQLGTAGPGGTGGLPSNCPQGLVDVLRRSDQVSMCEALVRLVVHYAPMASSQDWEVFQTAVEMLEDIERLEGREKESSLLQAWASNPNEGEGEAFFKEQVLKPIHEVGAFAIDIINSEFGNSGTIVRR